MGAPSLLDAQAKQVLDRLNAMTIAGASGVDGSWVTDGGTSQPTGAASTPVLDLDVSAGYVVIDGIGYDIAAAADVDSDGGAQVAFTAVSGESAEGVLCAFDNAGALGWQAVFGAVATTGSEAAPTVAEIDTAIGDDDWVVVCGVNLERTGDTAITVVLDHSKRVSGAYRSAGEGTADFGASLDSTSA